MSGLFIIVRHGESEWNALGKWTGTTDVHLTDKGRQDAITLGEAIKDIKLDYVFVSSHQRTIETLEGIFNGSKQLDVPYQVESATNERDYGDLTGKNKWEVKQEIGEEAFQGIRRGWDYPVPGGETLKDVYNRTVPFFREHILPRVANGQNVLLVANGNSIRSLMKYIEDISDEGIAETEMIFGTALIYVLDKGGRCLSKEVRKINTSLPPA